MQTTMQRWCAKVLLPGDLAGCWEWVGSKNADGYACLWHAGRNSLAQRVSYEQFVGPIIKGFEVDHLCKNRGCVNPAHLEAVTHRENVRRSRSANREKQTCLRGHQFSERKVRVRKTARGVHTERICRQCLNEARRVG